MSAMPVPSQISSLAEMPDKAEQTPIKQWYEEEPIEVVDQTKTLEIPVENVSKENTTTLIPSNEVVINVLKTNDKSKKQEITTIKGEDPITSLADDTENEMIEEINSAHGTR